MTQSDSQRAALPGWGARAPWGPGAAPQLPGFLGAHGPRRGRGGVPCLGCLPAWSTQPSTLFRDMSSSFWCYLVSVGPGRSPLRSPSERARAADSQGPLILRNRLCAQTAFLAWAGRMRSASEEDFHRAHQSSPKSRGRPLSPLWSLRPALSLPVAISRKLPAQDLSLSLPTWETRLPRAAARVTLPSLPWCPQHGPELRRGNLRAVCLRPGSGVKCPGSEERGRQWGVGRPRGGQGPWAREEMRPALGGLPKQPRFECSLQPCPAQGLKVGQAQGRLGSGMLSAGEGRSQWVL